MLVNTRLVALRFNPFAFTGYAPSVANGVKNREFFLQTLHFFLGIARISVYFATVSARDSATASC